MDIYEIISSNQTQTYVSKVFGTTIGLGDFIFWIVLSSIIGFTALTIRYTFNPNDKEEYELWKNEHWPTKIFICLMIGGLSFLTIETLLEFSSALNYLIYGSTEKFDSVFRKGLLGSVLFSIVYSAGFIWTLSKRGDGYYKDLKKFALFSIYAIVILGLLGGSLFILRNSVPLGLAFIAFTLIVLVVMIVPFYVKPKNYQEKSNLKKKIK